MPKSDFKSVSQVSSLSERVDWLTITVNTPERKAALHKRFLKLNEALKLMGEMPDTFHFRGYKGLSIGNHVHWGSREDSDILVLSGADACAFWGIFAPMATNCSRIDLAVTANLVHPIDIISECVDWIRENYPKTLQKLVRVERQDGVGQTLYVQSRASSQYGRIYDKGVQENPKNPMPHTRWRYEIEYKGDLALPMLNKLIEFNKEWAVNAGILGTVYNWFDSRDVPPVFSKSGGLMMTLDLEAVVSSSEQRLKWLSKQVRPSIAKLLAEGLRDETLDALGLA